MTDSPKSKARSARQRLITIARRVEGIGRAFIQVIIMSFVLQIFALISPYYLQIAIDGAVAQSSTSLLTTLALSFTFLAVLTAVTSFFRWAVLLEIGTSVGVALTSDISRKLLRLPIRWFVQRNVGDILSRFQSAMQVRYMLTEEAPAALVDGPLAFLTLLVMFWYSWMLALVAVGSLVCYVAVKAMLYHPQRSAQIGLIRASGLEQSTLIESVRGIRVLRLFGYETRRHAVWREQMLKTVDGTYRLRQYTNWQSIAHDFIFAIENVMSVWIAAYLVIDAKFTVGMIFSYFAYKMQFMTAGASLADKVSTLILVGTHLDRVREIAEEEDDYALRSPRMGAKIFAGEIELRNVSFRYDEGSPLILNSVDLRIPCGQSVAITGPSGSGKSTLLSVLLGLIPATSGEILIDGEPISTFGYQNFHRQIACVLQEDSLFAGSIAMNIAMFDKTADRNRVEDAADMAVVREDIERMAGGFEAEVGDMGDTLSGGQRQRLFLARAFYRRPKMIVSDEGTSQLDETTEAAIIHNLAMNRVTRIFVAHRRQTIDSAEAVYHLDSGKLRRII